MTKTLTEQWRDGTLPIGNYYIRVKERGEEKIIEHKISGSAFFYDQNVLLEIVAPVPSYDEYKQLVSKTEQLEKKLEIATKALKKIERIKVGKENNFSILIAHSYSKEALKEMEGVK